MEIGIINYIDFDTEAFMKYVGIHNKEDLEAIEDLDTKICEYLNYKGETLDDITDDSIEDICIDLDEKCSNI